MLGANLFRYLFSQRGEVEDHGGVNVQPVSQPSTINSQPSADWRESYKADPELGPVVSGMTEKSLPDVLKSYGSLKSMMGKAVFVKDPNNPEELQGARKRAYDMGLFPSPPDSPDKYQLTKPPEIPDAAWNKEIESEYRSIFHKYGIPDQAAQELFQTHLKQFNNVAQAYEIDHAQAMQSLNTWCGEIKANPAEVMAKADDFINRVVKNDPDEKFVAFVEKTGMLPIGHPTTTKLLGTAGLAWAQSTGETGEASASSTAEMAYQEAKQINANPSHPLYAAFHAGESHPQHAEAVRQYEAGFRAKFGTQEINK